MLSTGKPQRHQPAFRAPISPSLPRVAAAGSLPRGVLLNIDAAVLLVMARAAAATQNFAPLKDTIRNVFSSPSALSACFLSVFQVGYALVICVVFWRRCLVLMPRVDASCRCLVPVSVCVASTSCT